VNEDRIRERGLHNYIGLGKTQIKCSECGHIYQEDMSILRRVVDGIPYICQPCQDRLSEPGEEEPIGNNTAQATGTRSLSGSPDSLLRDSNRHADNADIGHDQALTDSGNTTSDTGGKQQMRPKGFWVSDEGLGILRTILNKGGGPDAYAAAAKETKTSVDNIKQAMYRSGLLKQRVKPVSSPVAANSSLEPTGPQGPMLEIKVRILGQELSYSQFLELFNQMATLRDAMKRPT